VSSLALLALAGCGGSSSASLGRVAFQRQLSGQFYAIELPRGFTLPAMATDAAFFKQSMPLAWDQIRDGAMADRLLADFNANNAQWQELPKYKQDLLWRPQAEPPL